MPQGLTPASALEIPNVGWDARISHGHLGRVIVFRMYEARVGH